MQFSDITKRSFKIAIYLMVASFVWSILGIFVAEISKAVVLNAMFTVSNSALSLAVLIFTFKFIYMGSKDMAVGLMKPKLQSESEAQSESESHDNNEVISDYPDVDNSDVYYFDDDNDKTRANYPTNSKQFVYDCA
jgi:hypothetical protein